MSGDVGLQDEPIIFYDEEMTIQQRRLFLKHKGVEFHMYNKVMKKINKTKMIIFSFILSLFANHLPVMYVQVPQWADDWAVCAVDIPDAKCHWYVMAPDNTFGEGFDWESAPWFDANGLNDVAPMQASTVVEKLQNQ